LSQIWLRGLLGIRCIAPSYCFKTWQYSQHKITQIILLKLIDLISAKILIRWLKKNNFYSKVNSLFSDRYSYLSY
jgi:hypothetical protein